MHGYVHCTDTRIKKINYIKNKSQQSFFTDCKGHKRVRSDKPATIKVTTDTSPSPSNISLGGRVVLPVNPKCVHFIPVTSLVVGEVMSKDDAFYTPHTNNPFVAKFKDANTKLVSGTTHVGTGVGPRFDLPSPSHPYTPPGTPASPDDWQWIRPLSTWFRQCHSLPGSPTALLAREADELKQLALLRPATGSNVPVVRCYEDTADDSALMSSERFEDTFSDCSSDSAIWVEALMRDLHVPPDFSSSKYVTSRNVFSSDSTAVGERDFPGSRRRGRNRIQHWSAAANHEGGRTTAWEDELTLSSFASSSESCVSLDDSALLSPTSSYSGDSDFWYQKVATWEVYRRLPAALEAHQRPEKVHQLVKKWELTMQNQAPGSAAAAAGGGRESHLGFVSSSDLPCLPPGSVRRDFLRPPSRHLHARLGYTRPNLERKFQELKQSWAKLLQDKKTTGVRSLTVSETVPQDSKDSKSVDQPTEDDSIVNELAGPQPPDAVI